MDDRQVVAVQLERPLRAAIDVRARCPLQLPVVVAVPPLLDDGTPFPTRYWLTCPLARLRVDGQLPDAASSRCRPIHLVGPAPGCARKKHWLAYRLFLCGCQKQKAGTRCSHIK